MVGGHAVFLHGVDDLQLVGLGDGVDGVKPLPQGGQNGLAEGEHGVADAQLLILFVHSSPQLGNFTPLRRMMRRMG